MPARQSDVTKSAVYVQVTTRADELSRSCGATDSQSDLRKLHCRFSVSVRACSSALAPAWRQNEGQQARCQKRRGGQRSFFWTPVQSWHAGCTRESNGFRDAQPAILAG